MEPLTSIRRCGDTVAALAARLSSGRPLGFHGVGGQCLWIRLCFGYAYPSELVIASQLFVRAAVGRNTTALLAGKVKESSGRNGLAQAGRPALPRQRYPTRQQRAEEEAGVLREERSSQPRMG